MSEAKLRIEYIPLEKLLKWPKNPKQHATDIISESMDRWGYTSPIIIDETSGRMVSGHGRVEALLLKKKAKEDPPKNVIEKDGKWYAPVVRGNHFKNAEEAEAYLIADNQLVILGGYDEDLLKALLKTHQGDLLGTGFSDADLLAQDSDRTDLSEDEVGWTIRVDVTQEEKKDELVALIKGEGFDVQVSRVKI